MTNQDSSSTLSIGLRSLTEEDLISITDYSYSVILKHLSQYVSKRDLEYFDIVIDTNYNDVLSIDLDISLTLPIRLPINEEKVINETLEASFEDIDHYLQENFT
ncbi:MAG: DUF3194 domain-containing protein [Asgard group archaeon]|nr:DUF3194 domain-containing protein [Asgard group archaeon]